MAGFLAKIAWLKKQEFERFRMQNAAIHSAGGDAMKHISERLTDLEQRVKELESIVKGHE